MKIPNPGKDLSDEITDMKAMAARTKSETYSAPYGEVLDVDSAAFEEKLQGTELGNVDMTLRARKPGGGEVIFRSRDKVDRREVVDTGNDLQAAMEVVLGALLEYLGFKDQPAQPTLDHSDGENEAVEET